MTTERTLRDIAPPTPTPWTIGVAGNCNVVKFDSDNIRPIAHTMRDADAEFIVRAVNSHAALVEALEWLTHILPRRQQGRR